MLTITPVLLALGAGVAFAARQPTFKEREAITAALPAFIRAEPVGCVWLDISVANNGKYALAGPEFLNALKNPCLRYAANGYWILKKTTKWKIIFNGSDPPSCSLGVPKDLTACRR